MTGDPSNFSMLTSKEEGYVTFGDNNQGKIIGKGTIGNKLKFSILNWFLYYLHLFHRNEEAGDATDYIYMYLPYPMYSILTSCLRYYHCVKCSLWT